MGGFAVFLFVSNVARHILSCHRKLRPMTQETLRGMRTRAKKKYVASDRARRKNVARHILS